MEEQMEHEMETGLLQGLVEFLLPSEFWDDSTLRSCRAFTISGKAQN